MNSETVQDAGARVKQWLVSEYPLGVGVSAETVDAVCEIPGGGAPPSSSFCIIPVNISFVLSVHWA